MALFEKPAQAPAGLRDVLSDLGWPYALNGLAAFVFACTSPVAIIITVTTGAGLTQSDIASWLFGGFALGGLITIGFSLTYRQPLGFAWTIPGTVLLGPALTHLSFQEVIGAFWGSGMLILALAMTGWIRTATRLTPLPIVMAMVAGVFLSFALNVVQALREELWIAASMIVAYVAVANVKSLERMLPPVVAALAVGAIVTVSSNALLDAGPAPALAALPNFHVPVFSLQALLELVVPLSITVIAVQNAQGFAILQSAGHQTPVNTMTAACGIGSFAFAAVGSVCTCVTGPSNAILTSYGARERQYTSAVVFGVLGILFGVLAAATTWLALLLPTAYIATLGGLGVLRALQGAFVTAFSERFTLGALVTFVVTVSDVSIYNVGAPFWGLVFGLLASALLERDDFRKLRTAHGS